MKLAKKGVNNGLIILFIIFCCTSVLIPRTAHTKQDEIHLTMAASNEQAEIFLKEKSAISCKKVNTLIGDISATKDYLDLSILCKSFNDANLNVIIHMIKTADYHKALYVTQNGFADMTGVSLWKDDIDEKNFLVSEPIIKKNEYQKGIYTLPEHPLQHTETPELHVNKYIAITVNGWHMDNKVLKKITPLVTEVSSFSRLYDTLAAKRADFTLIAFGQTSSMTKKMNGISLVPVKGIKVSFNTSRHFVITKTNKHAQKIINAINNGIKNLRDNGKLKQIYKNANFFKQYTKNWYILNQ